ncbi:MAG: very short patch repair endonuclease [Burkholderiales bacterium]
MSSAIVDNEAMVDVVKPTVRSRMMSGIRGKNTKPEMVVRRASFAAGYRFRLHRRDLPGAPDIVLPGRKVAVFVHGCFWHMHAGCRYARLPSTRPEFWLEKLEGNVARDHRAIESLLADGWRVLTVWECATRGAEPSAAISKALSSWIECSEQTGEISSALPP